MCMYACMYVCMYVCCRSIGWVEEEERLSIVSTHCIKRGPRSNVRQSGNGSSLAIGGSDNDILMAIGLFDVWPLKASALLEIRKSVGEPTSLCLFT
jgi:hypothetical protein